MNDKFKPIDAGFSDEDIISVDEKLLIIKQFKEEFINGFKHSLSSSYGGEAREPRFQETLIRFLRSISLNQTGILGESIIWESRITDCKVLRLGSKNWQEIRVRFRVRLGIVNSPYRKYESIFDIQEVFIEYCIDEPETPESPLDEMRKAFEQNS